MTELDSRIPQWSPEILEPRLCPLCHASNDHSMLRRDGLNLSFCPTCSLWYVSRIPGQKELEAFYRDYFSAFRSQELDGFLAHRLTCQAQQPDYRLDRLDSILGGLEGRKILEIGCGLGLFLLKAKHRGADAVGIDLCEEACEFARAHFHLDVSNVTLEACNDRIGAVDAIVMNDLIEHISDLGSFLTSLNSLLKKDGVVLIWTPNGGAAGRDAATGGQWLGFQVDFEHLQFFSPKSMSVLGEKYGWSIEHLETRGFPDLGGVGCMNARQQRQGFMRSMVRRFPAVRRCLWELKGMGSKLLGKPKPPQAIGGYHLFTILRKN